MSVIASGLIGEMFAETSPYQTTSTSIPRVSESPDLSPSEVRGAARIEFLKVCEANEGE